MFSLTSHWRLLNLTNHVVNNMLNIVVCRKKKNVFGNLKYKLFTYIFTYFILLQLVKLSLNRDMTFTISILYSLITIFHNFFLFNSTKLFLGLSPSFTSWSNSFNHIILIIPYIVYIKDFLGRVNFFYCKSLKGYIHLLSPWLSTTHNIRHKTIKNYQSQHITKTKEINAQLSFLLWRLKTFCFYINLLFLQFSFQWSKANVYYTVM